MYSDVEYDQTPGAWDRAASNFSELANKTSITRVFSVDCIDLTIPKNGVKDGLKILDIAAGTGALSIPAAQRVKDHNGHVIATDFSPEMLRMLTREVSSLSTPLPIETMVMDGQNLQFPENTFDFAYSAFGVIFFPDKKRGFTEILRVLKPGGKTGIVTWSEKNPLSHLSKEAINKIYTDTGVSPPLKTPMESLSDANYFEQSLKEVGFKNIVISQSTHTLRLPAEQYLKFYKSNPVIESMRLQLPESIRDRFDPTLLEVMKRSYPTGEVAAEAIAYIAIAEK